MKTFTIAGKPFEFDDSKRYRDFYRASGERVLIDVPFGQLLEALADGVRPMMFAGELMLLDRWTREAPRKRFYRGLKVAGVMVVSAEYWFEDRPDAEAEEIFGDLENTGTLARRILEAFLPEIAARCKEAHHPAEAIYPDP